MKLSLVLADSTRHRCICSCSTCWLCRTLAGERRANGGRTGCDGRKGCRHPTGNLPEVREVIDRSVGYVVVNMRVTKIPMVGAGSGYGVVVDKRTNTRSYIRVSRLEVGGGLGAQKFKVVIVYEDEKHLDRIAAGTWHFDAGAEIAAGSASAGGAATESGKGYQAFRLAESGATATVTLRAAHAKPYLRD